MAGSKEVKEFLRKNGIDTKNIRVNSKSQISVKLLDPKLNYNQIEKLLEDEFESYQRDEKTGEILSAGNTFVSVEFDDDLIKEISEKLMPTIRPFLEKCSGRWTISALVDHYADSQTLEYDVYIVKRAIQPALNTFLKENPSDIDGLFIDGWK